MADGKLYSAQLLGLATSLAAFPFSGSKPIIHEARSKTCGSTIKIELTSGSDEAITAIGLQVQACAVGQAAAAIMADAAIGKTLSDFAASIAEIEQWLSGEAAVPHWPGFAPLLPVRTHKGRHGSLLLPWQTAFEALSLVAAPS